MSAVCKIDCLREQMRLYGLDYYWVPGNDPHNSEYVAPFWQRREYVSGFTGSNGDLLVSLDQAWLWTDSRYFLQAETELDAGSVTLQRIGIDPDMVSFVSERACGGVVGYDPLLVTIEQGLRWSEAAERSHFKLSLLRNNLVDAFWSDVPDMPDYVISPHSLEYAGVCTSDKLSKVREQLVSHDCDYCVISDLTQIAWVTNCRGRLFDELPVFLAYMIIGLERASLFVDLSRLPSSVVDALANQGITCHEYTIFMNDGLGAVSGKVWLDPKEVSLLVQQYLAECDLFYQLSPVSLLQACKNKQEQFGMREAHRIDGLAMVRFLTWVHVNWQGQTELTLTQKLLEFRQQSEHFQASSFKTICGYSDHGAIVHYSASEESAYEISNQSCLLLDSGGQYFFGTTDITRVLHFGQPTEEERWHYTLVLKGHVALSMRRFSRGTCGEHLDLYARQPLLDVGLDYGHGTGHGVGSYLSVHEGPQRISPVESGVELRVGMVLSNEPGVYLTGKFGIRIENCFMVQSSGLVEGEECYHFETLTMVPYARYLIDVSLLTDVERVWLNGYHDTVYETYQGELSTSEKQWLFQATRPL